MHNMQRIVSDLQFFQIISQDSLELSQAREGKVLEEVPDDVSPEFCDEDGVDREQLLADELEDVPKGLQQLIDSELLTFLPQGILFLFRS